MSKLLNSYKSFTAKELKRNAKLPLVGPNGRKWFCTCSQSECHPSECIGNGCISYEAVRAIVQRHPFVAAPKSSKCSSCGLLRSDAVHKGFP